ncbi:MAG: hypothetical protein AAGF59_00610 [Pseudomonadota bacterium]
MSWLEWQRIAALRGDGLVPELRRLLELEAARSTDIGKNVISFADHSASVARVAGPPVTADLSKSDVTNVLRFPGSANVGPKKRDPAETEGAAADRK